MEESESIYEEIMTRGSEACGRLTNDKDISQRSACENSIAMRGLEMSADAEDSLYAVVNGQDVEFKKLGDLLSTESAINTDAKFAEDSEEIAQDAGLINFEETDSGCDCSQAQMGKELIEEANSSPRRPNSLKLNKINETIYSEVLQFNPAAQIDLRPARFTRESSNPILRQEVVSSSPSTSKPPSRSGSFKRSRNEDSTRSGSGDSGFQEDFQSTAVVYGNASTPTSRPASRPVSRQSSSTSFQVYENAASVKTPEITDETVYANMDNDDLQPQKSDNKLALTKDNGVYENLESEEQRPRAASQPIAIQRKFSLNEQELLYSDLDFKESCTESLSSSPDSSVSSWLSASSNNNSSPFNPPPLPNRPSSVYCRQRQTSFSSVSMTSSVSPTSGLRAHLIGSHTVHRTTSDSINSAIADVGNKSTALDVKSVSFEINRNMICLGKLQHPYDCILQIPINDVHILDKYNKDQRFFGIVASKPGKEGVCHVFQSDQSSEIIEMVKQVFNENVKRPRHSSPDRPKSLYGLVEFNQNNSFPGLIKIGSMKVKKSYLVINEIISSLLEKTNPKDHTRVNIRMQQSEICVSNHTGENEEKHSVHWVLSLGLYNKDGRYFAFTVSRTKNGKTRMFCHVFRSNRASSSASVLEGIRSACQNSLMYGQAMPRMSQSMPRSGFESMKPTHVNADAVSRSSTSSEETITSFDTKSITSTTSSSPAPRSTNTSPTQTPLKTKRLLPNTPGSSSNSSIEEATYGNVIKDNNELKEITETNDNAKEDEIAEPLRRKLSVNGPKEKTFDEQPQPRERKASLFKGKLFRGTLNRKKSTKLSGSMHSLNIDNAVIKEDVVVVDPVQVERRQQKFLTSYLCSAVVNGPLKPKHVEKCLKQFQKEVTKKKREGTSIGNVLLLDIITDEGVTMVNVRNPDSFRRHFPIPTIEAFIMHPEDPDCFAFSTIVPGDQQRKYHLFYKEKESISLVKGAFDLLKQNQLALGI